MRRTDQLRSAAFHTLTIIAALAGSASPALAARVPVRAYTTQDGLPRDFVSMIAIEPSGHVLLGTAEGLTVFDGHSFATWSEEAGLGETLHAVHTEPSGAIWAGGEFGLARLVPERPNRFDPVPAPSGMPERVVSLFQDRDGTLWVGSMKGLHRIQHGPDGPYFGPPMPGIETEVDAMAQDREGFLWIGTHRELALVDIAQDRVTARFTRGITSGDPHIQALMVDRAGRLWVGSRAGLCHLALDAAPERDSSCERLYTMRDGLPTAWINDIHEGPDGELHVATADGFVVGTRSASGGVTWKSLREEEGVPGGAVHKIAQDSDGNLWLATADRGAVKIVSGGLHVFTKVQGVASGVKSFVEDARGVVHAIGARWPQWFIMRSDGARFTSVAPRLPGHVTYLGWGWQQVIFQDTAGRWWVPSGSGALIYPQVARLEDLAGKLPERIMTRRDGLPGDEIFRLFEDSRGDVWIGTIGVGANSTSIWRRASGAIEPRPGPPGQLADPPSAFAEDPTGAVWIGYYHGGLARWSGSSVEAVGVPEGLAKSLVTQMHFDRRGRLWVGTLDGLARTDDPSARPLVFRTYTRKDGLPSHDVHSVAEDRLGRIWLGTSNGLLRLDPETDRTRRYTTADGLPANQVDSVFYDTHGQLWLGTREGLATLEPREDPAPALPPVLLESIEVAGEPRRLPPLGLDRLEGLVLPAGQERIRVGFRSIVYRAGETVRFQYRLDGSPDWSPISDQRSVLFDSIPAGRHRFEVRAVDLEGRVSPQPAWVDFRVEPPLWRTWWFMALAGASVAGAVIALHRQRVARLLALERVRARIATDLHDEVGAGLSEIALMGELWARQASAAPAGDGLPSRIAATSRKLVDSMSDIVWAINPEKDHVFSLSQRMRRFATTLLRSAGIALRFDSIGESHDHALDGEARRELLLAFQEMVHNCVKHAKCTTVDVRLGIEGTELVMKVADDGRGFDPTRAEEGTGLSSLRQRAGRLGGGCEIAAAPGAGTSVTIRVPLNRPRQGPAAARSSPIGEGREGSTGLRISS